MFGNNGIDILEQEDGNILVAGYTYLNYIYMARYLRGGTLDPAFAGGQGYIVDATGYGNYGARIALQADGKILVTGCSVSGNIYVARYTSAGVLDTTFNSSGTQGYIIDSNGQGTHSVDIAIATDGKILVTGYQTGTNLIYVARYTSAGVLDTSFTGGNIPFNSGQGYLVDATGLGSAGQRIALQTDGKILVTGYQTGTSKIYVARYTSAGVLDTTFNSSGTQGYFIDTRAFGNSGVNIAIATDNKILITGQDASTNDIYLARYSANGILDTSTFNTPNGYINASHASPTIYGVFGVGIALQADGKILLADTTYPNSSVIYLTRYTTNGTLDTSFGSPNGYIIPTSAWYPPFGAIAVLSSGSILLGGFESDNSLYIAQYTSSGILNSSGALPAPQGVQAMIVDGSNRVVMVGADSTSGWIQRYTTTGAIDFMTADPAMSAANISSLRGSRF
jgi:uncharacterized delta-60 repeat protein